MGIRRRDDEPGSSSTGGALAFPYMCVVQYHALEGKRKQGGERVGGGTIGFLVFFILLVVLLKLMMVLV